MSWLSICFIVSRATPTAIRIVVPAEREVAHPSYREDDLGNDGDGGEEQRAGQGDAVEDLAEVPLGRRTGPDAGDEPALLADEVGLLVRVEGDRRVEVGEEDDQQAVDADVDEVVRLQQVVLDEVVTPSHWMTLESSTGK